MAFHKSNPSNYLLTILLLFSFTAVGITSMGMHYAPIKKGATKPRLPNNYGKIGLSDPQKDKIYSVLKKYNDKIEILEKEIAELKTKRDAEASKVLTTSQVRLLHQIEARK